MLTKPKFRNQFERVEKKSISGDRYEIEKKGRRNRNGDIEVYETGQKIDRYALIQSHADSCDLNLMVKKFTEGDPNALNRRKAEYLDLTAFPSDYSSLLNTIENGKDLFAGLPTEVKEKFGNDFQKFVSLIGTNEWYEYLNINNKKSEEIIERKEKTSESEV